MTDLVIPYGRGKERRKREALFAEQVKELQGQIGFRISSRGWAYQLEGFGLINKDQFDQVQREINKLRKRGLLPIDFTAEEEGRVFSGVEVPTRETPEEHMKKYLTAALKCEEYYTPDWWDGEDYYIQMVVEKVDLKTLFEPICRKYKIPIATSKGWASMLMRAKYARRFKRFEEEGYKCVLLYCGDHDPAGLLISDYLRKNLRDLRKIHWRIGGTGYDPKNLIIERFGLNADFIEQNNLTWIDNLVTGSGRNLASHRHPDHDKDYVQEYLSRYGARKCEANALVVNRDAAEGLITEAIEKYLGKDAYERFEVRRQTIRDRLQEFREDTGLQTTIEEAIELIEAEEYRREFE